MIGSILQKVNLFIQVVEHPTQAPKVKGLNPDTDTGDSSNKLFSNSMSVAQAIEIDFKCPSWAMLHNFLRP